MFKFLQKSLTIILVIILVFHLFFLLPKSLTIILVNCFFKRKNYYPAGCDVIKFWISKMTDDYWLCPSFSFFNVSETKHVINNRFYCYLKGSYQFPNFLINFQGVVRGWLYSYGVKITVQSFFAKGRLLCWNI